MCSFFVQATKRIEEFQGQTKEYVATLQLGATTASYDMEHEVNETFATAHITRALIDEKLAQFVGDILQTPPTYSAVKVKGERAYDLRRSGESVQLKPKQVHIEQIEVLHFDAERMQLQLRVVCGKGTYIRALARDLGRALQSGAYLTELRRTRVGAFTVDTCLDYENILAWLGEQET